MSSSVKQEFFRWIASLEPSKLNEIEIKLLNLLVAHFEILVPLSTTQGSRAKKINELIQKHHISLSTKFPDILSNQSDSSEKYNHIAELRVGPFRGFVSNESFVFDKKYTFMYGPNGSGKSSFCEGLEYALLGGIEEADAKRISLDKYILNTQTNFAEIPVAYSTNSVGQKIKIPCDQSLYRFAFVEKNRIDGFARITATTINAQKERIATLFGLDAFSTFVDGFTDDFEKYIPLINAKSEAFKVELQKHENNKKRISEIDSESLKNSQDIAVLLKEVSQKDIQSMSDLQLFLNGEDGLTGHIDELQKKKVEQIPEGIKIDLFELFLSSLLKIKDSLKSLTIDIEQLKILSPDVNFRDLYSAIVSISSDLNADIDHCPACKTPIEQVNVNPFENAKEELQKLKSLAALQKQIPEAVNSLSEDIRRMNSTIKDINCLVEITKHEDSLVPLMTEIAFTNIAEVGTWKSKLETELEVLQNLDAHIQSIRVSVLDYNNVLSTKRELQKNIDNELKKYQAFNVRLTELSINKKKLADEKEICQKTIDDFSVTNAEKLKDIECEAKKITINQQYVSAYKKLILSLKSYRNNLPSKLSAGLSEKVKEYYNVINAHDAEYELIDTLVLPATTGAKIEIKFKGDTRNYDALHILSEGHIKTLGLAILLAKAVHDGLGFLIFDDIVNAIDDDHRSGVANLLLCHTDLKDRQHILTCHGETFINKLEHILGASFADKHVKSYRFIPADVITTRGVLVSIGNSKHYLLKAKDSLKNNNLRDSAVDCRRAVESISNQLWKKLDKQLKLNLKVTMRAPNTPPDLYTVVDSLIMVIDKINGLKILHENLLNLKEKYLWNLLNKGVHEHEDQPEFERNDISQLLTLIENIEQQVSSLKSIELAVSES